MIEGETVEKGQVDRYPGSHISALFVSLAGVALVLIASSRYGPGALSDSAMYLDCARSLANMEGFGTFLGTYHRYAPLYPVLISPFILAGMEPSTGALVLNSLMFGGVIYLGFFILKETLSNRILIGLGIGLLIFSKPLLNTSVNVWSELPFNLLALFSLFFLYRSLRAHSWKYLVLSGLFAGLACLARYIGVLLIISGVIVLLISIRDEGIPKRIKKVLAFGSIASLPISIYLARNLVLTSTLMGERYPSTHSLFFNIERTSFAIANWFFPSLFPGTLFTILAIFIMMVLIVSILFGIKFAKTDRGFLISSFPWISFFVTYTLFLILISTFMGFDTISERLMSPAYIPFLFYILHFLDHLGSRGKVRFDIRRKISNPGSIDKGSLAGAAIVITTAGILLLSSISIGAIVASKSANGAGGFSTEQWEDSPTMGKVYGMEFNSSVYSNDPWAVNYFTGMDEISLSPRKHWQATDRATKDIEELTARLEFEEFVFLIWFDFVERDYLYTLDELKQQFHLEVMVWGGDGGIYLLSPIEDT